MQLECYGGHCVALSNHSCLRSVGSCCNQALAQAVRKGLQRLAVAGMLLCHGKGQRARRQAGKLFCNYVFRPALVQAALPWKVCNLNARVHTVLPCQITAACGSVGSCCNQTLAQAVRKGLQRLAVAGSAVAGMLLCHGKCQGARRQAGKLFCLIM